MEDIAGRIVAAERPPLLPQDRDVPPELSQFITKMLDREASQRPKAKQVVEVLQVLLQRKRNQQLEHKSPFRGLLPFTERHADLFFGRNAEIETAVERLRHEPILPLVGPSGAGCICSFETQSSMPPPSLAHQYCSTSDYSISTTAI